MQHAPGHAASIDVPLIDERAARRTGRGVLRPGPALSRAEASDVVEGLHRAAEASVAPISRVTLIDPPTDAGPMLVVDRPTWLDANVTMASAMMSDAAAAVDVETESREASGPKKRAEAVSNGIQLGAALGLLSSRVLGQYLPFGPSRLVLVAPNIVKVERELGVVPDDFRLWVCLHEQTHRLQFARAPWLRAHLARQLAELLTQDASGERRAFALPTSIVDVVVTPSQRVVFDKMTAVMSLLEGYADVMMDRVGPDVVPSVADIRRRFEARRDRGGWSKVINKLMGMDLKLAQYRDGASFCRAVIAKVGVAGLNAVYESPGMLPTLDEIHAPDGWLARAFPGV